jgi:hypothetical protein
MSAKAVVTTNSATDPVIGAPAADTEPAASEPGDVVTSLLR